MALACAASALSCLDLSWKEGIACGAGGRCPDALMCCAGSCLRACAPSDGGGEERPPAVVACPAEVGGCYACMPGCACTCAGVQTMCCLKFGVATCGGCP